MLRLLPKKIGNSGDQVAFIDRRILHPESIENLILRTHRCTLIFKGRTLAIGALQAAQELALILWRITNNWVV